MGVLHLKVILAMGMSMLQQTFSEASVVVDKAVLEHLKISGAINVCTSQQAVP